MRVYDIVCILKVCLPSLGGVLQTEFLFFFMTLISGAPGFRKPLALYKKHLLGYQLPSLPHSIFFLLRKQQSFHKAILSLRPKQKKTVKEFPKPQHHRNAHTPSTTLIGALLT